MNDRSRVMLMTQGIGAHLTNDEKRAHLTDLKREHLIDQVCIQEFLPPDIDRLAAAYEEALRVLHISDRDDPVNEVIARRIIEGARAGVRDTNALCQMAIKDLMVP